VSKSDRHTEGQLSERPLAELIREIIDAGLSGAIRLSNDPAKVVIYFDKGNLLFATSNVRAHRLREVFKRNRTSATQVDGFSSNLSDEELAAALLENGMITPAVLQQTRSAQVADVLRLALLWTAGEWSFDRRVRVDGDFPPAIEINRLLLESARQLPLQFIKSRVGVGAMNYSPGEIEDLPLSPAEAKTLARVREAKDDASLADLTTKDLREHDLLRAVYALCLGGVLRPDDQQTVLTDAPRTRAATKEVKAAAPAVAPRDPNAEANALFIRLNSATTHYEVLDVGTLAEMSEIKKAYHELARRFHPDRFHQSELRARLESAFARIGRAYETLSDEKLRRDYDKSVAAKDKTKAAEPVPAQKETPTAPASPKQPEANRAETSFKRGTEALERGQHEDAIRFLAEAATLEPRVGRYRAYYGTALMRNPSLRRTAETELQAALKLEPNNASFHLMLAELYQRIGLRKRAEHEALRALSADPANKSARELLSSLASK
jgi:curved DNA-binding protein CbpA